MEEKEIWKNVRGYEGLYKVSNLGRVKSLPRLRRFGDRMVMFKGRIKKDEIANNGYHRIGLTKDGKQKHFLVHRLVYEAFVGKIPDGMQINHLDECKDNNSISNLNIMTPSENINWASRNERVRRKQEKKVIMDGNIEFDSVSKAAEYFGCCHQSISACCRKRLRLVRGHTFRYK